MIREVHAHAGGLRDLLDLQCLEFLRATDAGELQQLR
jgi:hypothetical protein